MSAAVSHVDPDPGPSRSAPDSFDGTAARTSPVVVRRNAPLAALIGAAASAVAIAYLWRAIGSADPVDWAVCALMALLATFYLAHLVDARTPLVVADDLGVRVRLGHHWRGLPWDGVREVLVQPRRGLLRDGRLVFAPHSLPRALEGLDPRGRRAAALNQRVYGAPLAVPMGLSTRVSARGRTLADDLAALAHGRADVVVRASRRAERPTAAAAGRAEADAAPESEPRAEAAARPEPPEAHVALLRQDEPADHAPGSTAIDPDRAGGPPDARRRRGRLRDASATRGRLWDASAVRERRGRPGAAGTARTGGSSVALDRVVGPDIEEVRLRPVSTLGDADQATSQPLTHPMGHPTGAPFTSRTGTQATTRTLTGPADAPVIGPELAAARHRVGLSVDELAERTRIRPHVIESIEVDDFAPCGGDFYARGHLRTLARVLGRDPVSLLRTFDERYSTAPIDARQVFEAELATGMTGSMRSTVGGPSWALMVGVVLVLVLTWGVVRLFASEPTEHLANPAPALNGSAGVAGAAGPRSDAAPAPVVKPVQVRLVGAQDGSFALVRDRSGTIVWAGDIALGAQRTLSVTPPVRVRAENGGAITVAVDGSDRGLLGQPGASAQQLFHRDASLDTTAPSTAPDAGPSTAPDAGASTAPDAGAQSPSAG